MGLSSLRLYRFLPVTSLCLLALISVSAHAVCTGKDPETGCRFGINSLSETDQLVFPALSEQLSSGRTRFSPVLNRPLILLPEVSGQRSGERERDDSRKTVLLMLFGHVLVR